MNFLRGFALRRRIEKRRIFIMDIQQAYQYFFTQYGQPSKEANEEFRIWLRRPDTLDKIEDVAKFDEYAAEHIEKLEEHIAILKMYRQELCKQYNQLATAATAPGIRLERERHYYEKKVRYRITWYTHYIDSGKDVTNEYKLFAGTDRYLAIKEYKKYVKAHPGIIATMSIEKSKWER